MRPVSKSLGSLERQLLDWLWERAWVDVRAAHAALHAPSRRSPNTVHSALERLIRKGLVERRRMGRAFEYRAVVTRAGYFETALTDTCEALPGRDAHTLLAAFVDVADRLDATALDELERLVAERKRRARKETEG